jgi:carbon monoxide dehydrogenase subunit G
MELHHEFVVPIGIDAAWEAFNDLERIGPAFPGAAVTGVDGDEFTGTAKVKLGPISLQYNGTGRFAERDVAARTAVIEAQGKDRRGNGTAGATIMASLTAEGDASTRVLLDTDLKITGRPAQFGRGVIQDVGSKILDQFAANLTTLLAAPEGASGEVDDAPVAEAVREPASDAEPEMQAAPPEPAPPEPAPTPVPDAPTPRQVRAAPEPAELDLGGVVGPALLQRYGVTVLAVVVTAVLTWLVARRGRP